MTTEWTTSERRAWQWPNRLKPSEWAQANRILPATVTAEPGPWRNERTPYLVGIMDAICEPGVEEIDVIKAAQVGFSEGIRNLLGFFIDHDPGPALVVLPDQKSAEELIEERIKPLLEHTPAVARHVTSRAWDVKKSAIRLTTMSIYVGWAGSSQALKSRPIRFLFLEEPDEYPAISGSGGDPISKAKKRVTTYAAKGRARTILGGTPTTRIGNVWKAWESCPDQRHYWVPCPHCGTFQRLYWKNVKWVPAIEGESRKQHAARIVDTDGAWYACENLGCGQKINETQKRQAIRLGMWASEDQAVTPDGRVVGPIIRHRRIGFHLPATYSPWVSFAQLAAEWVEAQDDTQQLADFINQRLAEPFEEQRSKTVPSAIATKAKNGPKPGVIPKWAKVLIATADTQGTDDQNGHFYYVVRAWGHGNRSQMVAHGIASSKAELKQRALEQPFQIGEGGRQASPMALWVDSGGPRWQEIYEWAQSDNRIHPTKGSAHRRTYMVQERPQKKHGIVLWEIDTEQSKDQLHRLIHDPDRTKWMPHADVIDQNLPLEDAGEQSDYCKQMCSESKIFDPSLNREVWTELVKNYNHWLDCEHQQCAVAYQLGCGSPEPQERTADEPAAEDKRGGNFINSFRGRW